MLWLAGPVWLVLFFCLPETYPENLLLRRARRLRALTGNQNLRSQSEIKQAQLSFRDVVFDALVKPVQLFALDPAIAYADIYIALCYVSTSFDKHHWSLLIPWNAGYILLLL